MGGKRSRKLESSCSYWKYFLPPPAQGCMYKKAGKTPKKNKEKKLGEKIRRKNKENKIRKKKSIKFIANIFLLFFFFLHRAGCIPKNSFEMLTSAGKIESKQYNYKTCNNLREGKSKTKLCTFYHLLQFR